MRATLEESFYNVPVTPDEMWLAVGRVLKKTRQDRNLTPTDVERAGGPSYKTVQAIEAGEAGTVESLDKSARALGLSIVDVLVFVLESRATPLTAQEAAVVRGFNETTVPGQQAILQLVQALPRQKRTKRPPSASGGAVTPLTPGPLRPGRPGPKRRTGE